MSITGKDLFDRVERAHSRVGWPFSQDIGTDLERKFCRALLAEFADVRAALELVPHQSTGASPDAAATNKGRAS